MSLTDFDTAMERANGLAAAARQNAAPPVAPEPSPLWNATDFLRTARTAIDELGRPGSADRIGENIRASANETFFVHNFDADANAHIDAYDRLLDVVNQSRGDAEHLANPYLPPTTAMPTNMGIGFFGAPVGVNYLGSREEQERRVWDAVTALRASNPALAGKLPATQAEFETRVLDDQRRILAEADAVRRRSGPTEVLLGQVIGGGGAGAADTPNLLALGLGGGASASILKTFLINGALNAGVDAAEMPWTTERMSRLGHPMSGEDIVTQLGADFVVGGSIPVGAHLVGRGLRETLTAFRARFPNAGPSARAAANVVEHDANLADDNPYAADPRAADQHRTNLHDAVVAADQGRPAPEPTAAPLVRALDPAIEAAQRRTGFTVRSFKPSEVGVDPATMQYKRGGDAAGVTDRLRGVTEWNPAFARLLTLYERLDGSVIAANGHQRVGLAKRLDAEGHDITLYGLVYREADGVTPTQMRVQAALENIAEGSGEAIDAASILRIAPEGVSALPRTGPFIKRAQALSRLSDDAWGMVWNGFAPERDAELVGRLVADPKLHASILDYVAKAEPDTAEEAALIVRQALAAGARTETQTDMFGAMLKADLILPERVKILKAALSQLRRDKSLFKTLTDRETTIAAAGNVLNADENARRADVSARMMATITALAERKGPVSDALQHAAEQSKAGGPNGAGRRAAIAGFVQDVRGRLEQGGLERGVDDAPVGPVGPQGAGEDVPAGPAAESAAQDLSLFGDPVAKPEAFKQQTQDLAREIAPDAKPIRSTNTENVDKPEFGEAQPEVEALRALDQSAIVPDQPHLGLLSTDDKPATVKDVRRVIEKDARLVEHLRGCIEGGE